MLVATNLRLSEQAVTALRAAAQQSGRSQQDLIREAVDRYLGLAPGATAREQAIEAGLVRPPTPFRNDPPTLRLPPGVSTADLLDREDTR